MPIWSFTQERLDRLKDQIVKKQAERDALAALSEKDLWCKDLDEFEAEWLNQLRLDDEISTGIRRMGRRTSKKIGAGRGRKAKAGDDDWAPSAKSRPGPKAAAKPKEQPKEKSVQRFAAMFNGGTKKENTSVDKVESDSDPFSDGDFAKLKNPAKKEKVDATQDSDVEVQPNPRTKRAAAAKARTWIVDDDESDSDDDKMLGDVGALVKGIANSSASTSENKTGRLSLFSMSRPESSSGNSAGLKVKSKASKVLDVDDHDDTNYEMLAKSSPHKNARGDELDSFLSEDDFVPAPKTTSKSKASASASEEPKAKAKAKPVTSAIGNIGGAAVKKTRGRPAGAKSKAKEDAPAKKKAPATKAMDLSPAAKSYAAKKKSRSKKDEDEDEDVVMAEPDSPPVRPAARGRRAAAVKSKPVYVIDDDDDDEDEDDFQAANDNDDDEESDPFAMDSD